MLRIQRKVDASLDGRGPQGRGRSCRRQASLLTKVSRGSDHSAHFGRNPTAEGASATGRQGAQWMARGLMQRLSAPVDTGNAPWGARLMPLCTADSVQDMIAHGNRMQGCCLLSTRCPSSSRALSPCSSAHSALAASAVFLAWGCLAGAATDLACTCTCCAALDERFLVVRTCSAAFRACHAETSTSLYHVALLFIMWQTKHGHSPPLQSSIKSMSSGGLPSSAKIAPVAVLYSSAAVLRVAVGPLLQVKPSSKT